MTHTSSPAALLNAAQRASLTIGLRSLEMHLRQADAWLQGAKEQPGSWWPDWTAWLAARSGKKGKPPEMGSADHPPRRHHAAPGRAALL